MSKTRIILGSLAVFLSGLLVGLLVYPLISSVDSEALTIPRTSSDQTVGLLTGLASAGYTDEQQKKIVSNLIAYGVTLGKDTSLMQVLADATNSASKLAQDPEYRALSVTYDAAKEQALYQKYFGSYKTTLDQIYAKLDELLAQGRTVAYGTADESFLATLPMVAVTATPPSGSTETVISPTPTVTPPPSIIIRAKPIRELFPGWGIGSRVPNSPFPGGGTIYPPGGGQIVHGEITLPDSRPGGKIRIKIPGIVYRPGGSIGVGVVLVDGRPNPAVGFPVGGNGGVLIGRLPGGGNFIGGSVRF